jgi:hypothetical protein
MEYAEGVAMAANPVRAWLAPGHLAAAKAYGVAAAGAFAFGTGLGARALGGGGGFSGETAGSYGSAGNVSGGENSGQRSGAAPVGPYSSRDEQVIDMARNLPTNTGAERPAAIHITSEGFGEFLRYEIAKGGAARQAILDIK